MIMRHHTAKHSEAFVTERAEPFSKPCTAAREATAVRDLLRTLFALSESQLAALDREDYAAATQIAQQKEELLPLLPIGVSRLSERGWALHNTASWPLERALASVLQEASDLARRLQAHERYMMGQMVMRKNRAADRLTTILRARHAAAGYQKAAARGATVDTAG
jgi:hypothetical protein